MLFTFAFAALFLIDGNLMASSRCSRKNKLFQVHFIDEPARAE